MRNIDIIRAMNDKEIARLFSGNIDCNICKILFNNEVDCVHCETQWREWLQADADEKITALNGILSIAARRYMDSWETKYALLNIQFNMLEMENDRLKEENRNLWNRINSLEQFIKVFGSVEMNSKFEIWNRKEEI